jgi:CMP-N-acetylneuraminic acid synthetase
MLARTIEQAKKAKRLTQIVVATDHEKILRLAKGK